MLFKEVRQMVYVNMAEIQGSAGQLACKDNWEAVSALILDGPRGRC